MDLINWMDKAACQGYDVDLFFGDSRSFSSTAKGICETCPVKQECLEYGLLYEEFGVWGGSTHVERRKTRKTNYFRELAELELNKGQPEPHHQIPASIIEEFKLANEVQTGLESRRNSKPSKPADFSFRQIAPRLSFQWQ